MGDTLPLEMLRRGGVDALSRVSLSVAPTVQRLL